MNRQRCTRLRILLFTAFSLIATICLADTIGVNFNNGGATLLDPTDQVGVVPTANWNNFRNNGGLGLINPDPTPLVDSTGVESQATVAWEVGSSYFNSNNGVGNQRMMEGWFGLNADDLGYIMIEDIPASFTGPSYDAYVYFDSDMIAPNERTMTFTANGASITGKELPTNYAGNFFEASGGSAGNFVIFRDLTAPTFELTADSDVARAAINGIQITTEPEPDPVLPPDPNDPVNAYNAAFEGNEDTLWLDTAGNQDWTLVDAQLLTVTSANTNITAAYQLFDPIQGAGGDTNPFPAGNMTYEMWVRPGDVSADHQMIFETGGGQNGTSVMLTQDTVRLLNSTLNERIFDMEVDLSDVNTSDFVQIVAALDASNEEIRLTVNGSAGGTASETQQGVVGRGGNRASLFTWGSGVQNLGAGTNNLGGRTELDNMDPEGLTQFDGEIALLNVFTRAFDADEIQTAFDAVATSGPQLKAGDANMDLQFDQLDLVQVQIAAKYLTGEPATWGEGDWEGAPGGSVGNPPEGNGLFDQLDIVAALGAGTYLNGPYAALADNGRANDGQTSVIYDPKTGELAADAPSGTELTSINIDSASGIFTGDAAANLGGSFDNDADDNIFKATFGSSFGSLSFGNVAQAGLSKEFVMGDLTVVGSLDGGGGLGEVDLIYVPEPTALLLLAVGLLAIAGWNPRKRGALSQ